MTDLQYYIGALVAIIIAVFIIKKVVGCLARSIVFIILVAALVVGYLVKTGQIVLH